MTDISRKKDDTSDEHAAPLSDEEKDKIKRTIELKKPCSSMPVWYPTQSLWQAGPVVFEHTCYSYSADDFPLGKSTYVDFYPAGILVFPGSGHDSQFPLFRRGGRSLPLFANRLQSQWSDWRARIEYCLREKWNDPKVRAGKTNYKGEFVTRVSKDKTVKVVAACHVGDLPGVNVEPQQLIEDLSGDAGLQFPSGSKADFVELLILLADHKEKGTGSMGVGGGSE